MVPDKDIPNNPVIPDPWHGLRAFTQARIALGRTGVSVPLSESLRFKLAHAHARDAVFTVLETGKLQEQLIRLNQSVFLLHSRAQDKETYLQRPDLGRKLNEASVQLLTGASGMVYDLVIVAADGLSAEAINRHFVPLLEILLPQLKAAGISTSPINLVSQGRVAIADEIGYLLKGSMSLILIGERPGLTSPDSMGAYLTYRPKQGLTDESRNCISNIRTAGLGYEAAAAKILYLIRESLRLQLSGVQLKDNTGLLS